MLDSQPWRRPLPHSIGEHHEVERVARLHLDPAGTATTGFVRRVEVLDHDAFLTGGHRSVKNVAAASTSVVTRRSMRADSPA